MSGQDDWRNAGFGLYVHWPFCASKCPYCDFNSHVSAAIDHWRWRAAYRAEIARVAAETPGRILNSIFFGGGTPSLMEPETVAAVIDAARAAWGFANDIEITLEANPGSVEAGRFEGFADAGVNRVSLGVQALNDQDLRRLGRLHTAAEARQAYDLARRSFGRVSFDLIYARQYQDLTAWKSELAEAAAMAVDHLSLYQLTIEEGTAFAARLDAGGLAGLPDDDHSAAMYLETLDYLEGVGLPYYEVSNHARPGSESVHNLLYWRQGDWAAVGPGAHGRLTLPAGRVETVALRAPGAWLSQVEAAGSGDESRALQSRADRALEYLLMSIRLREGVDLARLAALGGELDERGLALVEENGLAARADGRLAATRAGRPLLNAILR
ncbi:MAG: radical SAM family heme chaperone HemW, partial [Paracoccus sp. (in: a-proteobacteria)]|nr:radical SAM family heme chaperone HemW [Paracoccus sp. (in: a-proteobacteria)]